MATRSEIAIELNDEDIDTILFSEYGCLDARKPYLQIYCHFNGYIGGVGAELLEWYEDYDTVLALIMKGDCSTLGNEYAKSCRDICDSWEYTKPRNLEEPELNQEYLYMFKDGEWYVRDVYNNREFVLLKNAKDD